MNYRNGSLPSHYELLGIIIIMIICNVDIYLCSLQPYSCYAWSTNFGGTRITIRSTTCRGRQKQIIVENRKNEIETALAGTNNNRMYQYQYPYQYQYQYQYRYNIFELNQQINDNGEQQEKDSDGDGDGATQESQQKEFRGNVEYKYKAPQFSKSFLEHMEKVKQQGRSRSAGNNNDEGVDCVGEPSMDPSRMVQDNGLDSEYLDDYL